MSGAIQWAGAAMMAGSAALGLGLVLVSSRPVIGQAIAPDVAAILLLATALLILALPAQFAVQANRTGALGLAGHVLLTAGLLLPVLVVATPLLHPLGDAGTGEHPLVFGLGLALAVGLLLTGVATFQAEVLPRPAAVLLLAATAGFFFVFFVAEFLPPAAGQAGTAVFGVLLSLGFAWIGLALWQRA